MKTVVTHIRVLNCVAIVAALACCVSARAGGNAAPAKTDPAMPKSMFVDAPEKGKDPFFPNSSRRLEALPRITSATNNVPETSTLFNLLQLKGMSGTRGHPLAIINGITLSTGETGEIRCGRHLLKVRCREIRESSVLIELEGVGETRELKLRAGI
jgi:hypothetical protein